MKVIFYEIQDCYHELIDNKPAIIAPLTTDKELLSKYHFIQLLDGRWVHYMNEFEFSYMKHNSNRKTVLFIFPIENHQMTVQQRKKNIALIILLIIYFLITAYFFWLVNSCVNDCENDINNFPNSCQESQE